MNMKKIDTHFSFIWRKDTKKINFILNIIIAIAIIIAFMGFVRDFNNNIEYGGVDLRSNVIGARLLVRGIDPFTYVWKPGDSELFLHPTHDNSVPLSHVTVTPTVLAVYATTANLPYAIQQKLWVFLQWVFLLSSIYLLSKCTDSMFKAKLIWIIGLIFISSSFFWRLHAERNKIIIFYVFLFAFSYWIMKKNFKFNNYLSGFLLGFVTSLRPSYIFVGIPLLVYKKWKMIIGMVLGFLFGFLLPTIFVGFSVWTNYLSSMKFWSDFYLGKIPHIEHEYIRSTVEGMNNLYKYAVLPVLDTSLISTTGTVFGFSITPNISYILLIIVLIVCSALLIKFKLKGDRLDFLFLIGIFLVFLSEIFLPAQRWDYFNVIWLPILSLIIINNKSFYTFFKPYTFFIFITFIFNILYLKNFKTGILIGFISIFIYFLISIFYLYKEEYLQNKI